MYSPNFEKFHINWLNIIQGFPVIYTNFDSPPHSCSNSFRLQFIISHIVGLDLDYPVDVPFDLIPNRRQDDSDDYKGKKEI